MSNHVSLEEAAERLLLRRYQLEELVSAGWLPSPDAGMLQVQAVTDFDNLLFALEAGLLGLGEEFLRPPTVLPVELVALWLDVEVDAVAELEAAGRLERAPWRELSDEEVLDLLLAAEATVSDELWTTKVALLLDTLMWKYRRMGWAFRPKDYKAVRKVVGSTIYRTEGVRRLARSRRRFNPPRHAGRRA